MAKSTHTRELWIELYLLLWWLERRGAGEAVGKWRSYWFESKERAEDDAAFRMEYEWWWCLYRVLVGRCLRLGDGGGVNEVTTAAEWSAEDEHSEKQFTNYIFWWFLNDKQPASAYAMVHTRDWCSCFVCCGLPGDAFVLCHCHCHCLCCAFVVVVRSLM